MRPNDPRTLALAAGVLLVAALAAGYGVNLKMMFSRGLWLAVLLWAVVALVGYALAAYWPGFGIA